MSDLFSEQATTTHIQGKRMLVTRTRDQAGVLSERLQQLGALPIEFPTIRIVPPSDWSELDLALLHIFATDETGQPYYRWLVFTSANGVTICCERLRHLGYDPRALRSVRVATIGPATAAALARYGITADLIPDQYIAESVASALIADAHQHGVTLQGQRILLARAAEARKILVTALQHEGAHVEEVAAYYTHAVGSDDEQGQMVLHLLRQKQLDVLTFTSSSTVRNFVAWLKKIEPHEPLSLCDSCLIACIGPITTQTARELGLTVQIEATEFTIDGLVEAIVCYYTPTIL